MLKLHWPQPRELLWVHRRAFLGHTGIADILNNNTPPPKQTLSVTPDCWLGRCQHPAWSLTLAGKSTLWSGAPLCSPRWKIRKAVSDLPARKGFVLMPVQKTWQQVQNWNAIKENSWNKQNWMEHMWLSFFLCLKAVPMPGFWRPWGKGSSWYSWMAH